MVASTSNNNGSSASAAKSTKKIFIIFISFFPALALLSITNVILAHILVVTTILFPSNKGSATNNRPTTDEQPKNVQTKIVYVPPTQEDLVRIQQDLEKSDPLPPITKADIDEQYSTTRVQSIISSTEELLAQRKEQLGVAQSEIDELNEAYTSFVARLEQDTSGADYIIDDETTKQLEDKLTSLRDILGRKTFMDLDRQDVMKLFDMAMDELNWLLSVAAQKENNNALFFNANNILFKTLNAETNSTCQQSYLELNKGKSSDEFIPPSTTADRRPKVKDTKKKKVGAHKVPPAITDETARESDLYELVQSIKHILSRRDLTSVKLDENNESMPSPISDDGVVEIRSKIIPMVGTIEEKRRAALAQESEIREYWLGRVESLEEETNSLSSSNDNDGEEGGLCASSNLVEGMVTEGLEAFRGKVDLRTALESAALLAVQEDEEATFMLRSEMEKISIPEIDYERTDVGRPSSPGTSSWKVGKKSVSYLVDGPLIHHGVVGWIDFFVDSISGYWGKSLIHFVTTNRIEVGQ